MIAWIRRLPRRLAVTALACCAGLPAAAYELPQRRHILIVGSSTAYPIVAAAAERIARQLNLPTPVVESTGTGGGMKLFCGGTGLASPDIAMASRRMKESERTLCATSHVNDIREIKIGYDGVIIANSKHGPQFEITALDLYRALARQLPAADDPGRFVPNPYRTWQEVNPALPDVPIRVLGPPPTSGTRDIVAERLLQDACIAVPALKALRETDAAAFEQHCYSLREDGAFVNAGENDARLVRKLLDDPDAVGILGYNFVDRNRDRLQAARINGVEAVFETIESGVYPLSRPLYLYIKSEHANLLDDLEAFTKALLSDDVSGEKGYLVEEGLIPLPSRDAAAGD